MFELFTDAARRVLVLAQEEARLFDADHLGTEHILLGLIHEGDSVAAGTLTRFGVSLEAVRAGVESVVGSVRSEHAAHLPFTPRAKKVLELARREGSHFGDFTAAPRPVDSTSSRVLPSLRRAKGAKTEIRPGHLLLGLLAEGEGVAVQVLDRLGVDLTELRRAVLEANG